MSFTKEVGCVVIMMLVLATSCGPKNQQELQGPQAVNVTVQPVQRTNVSYSDEYPAIVRALNEVELRAQVNGYITGIYFTEGQVVKKGDKLYAIDQQQYEATYQQALANVAVQEANFIKAQKDVERYRELSKSDAIAKQQVDNAEANYTAAQKQVDAARATVRSVQTNVRYTTIVAPFEGTIGLSNVRVGAAVSAGQTLLNTISSDDPMAVDVTVDQSEISRFVSIQAKQTKNDSVFRLALGNELYALPGKITVIDRAVDAATGSIKVRISFPNPEHFLRAGMSAQLRVMTSTKEASILIPYKAVTEQLGEFFVYVTASENKVTQQRVYLGRQVGANIIVKEGLKIGDTIVVEGVQNLREGSIINSAAASKK